MQENEFEKQVQQKMEEFALLPKDEVWQNVAARIVKEKKRRTLILWVTAAFLLLGGTGVWWYIESNSSLAVDNSFVDQANKKMTHESTNTISINTQKKLNLKTGKAKAAEEKTHTVVRNTPALKQTIAHEKNLHAYKTSKLEHASLADKKATINTSAEDKREFKTAQQKKNYVSRINNTNASINSLTSIPFKPGNVITPLHKFYKTPGELLNDSIAGALANQKKIQPPVDITRDEMRQPKKETAIKHWQFGLTFYGGISDNVEGLKVVGAKSLAQNSSALNQSNGSYSYPQTTSTVQYKSKASFGIGASVNKQIAKRTAIAVGISYHYFSAGSLVGNKGSSSPNVYDTALAKQASAPAFYSNGSTTAFINKYHVLQLPVDFVFRLNKNVNKPFVFSFGVSPSFLISSSALYFNRGANIYYTEKKQFKPFMLFGQSAFMFTAIHSGKLSVSAGPAVQYDFNSFSKWQTGTNQHLIFTGIKTNIIFK